MFIFILFLNYLNCLPLGPSTNSKSRSWHHFTSRATATTTRRRAASPFANFDLICHHFICNLVEYICIKFCLFITTRRKIDDQYSASVRPTSTLSCQVWLNQLGVDLMLWQSCQIFLSWVFDKKNDNCCFHRYLK